MNITGIPFVAHLGITEAPAEGSLRLPYTTTLHNHLQTVHASAQFALAETASGACLQAAFPEWVGKVVPVLRDAQMKFSRPAQSDLTAQAGIADDERERFQAQLSRKGRSTITVDVEVRDAQDAITCRGSYTWSVQRINDA